MSDVRDAVRRYTAEGFGRPHPIPKGEKGPRVPNWQDPSRTFAPEEFDPDGNVGILLVDVVDIDHDTPEVVAVAPKLLPPTGRIHGRASTGASHYWYRVAGEIAPFQFKDVDGSVLVEIRTGATQQTVLPPSTHPSGERVGWLADRDPGLFAADALVEKVRNVAAAALLARRWPSKGRHDAAKHAAGFLVARQLDPKDVVAVIRAAAEAAGDDEVPDRVRVAEDTCKEFASGGNTTGGPSLAAALLDGEKVLALLKKWFGVGDAQFPNTEAGDAEFFAERYGTRVRFDHARKLWFVFTEHTWRQDPVEQLRGFGIETMRARQDQANKIDNATQRRDAWQWAMRGESRSRIDNMQSLARAIPPLADPGDGWNVDPYLLGAPNGIIDLRTGELRAGRAEDRITLITPVAYNPEARCERWMRFIDEICNDDQALANFLHRSIGYTMTGEITEQCFWLLYGLGANGKSTFLETLAKQVLPQHSWVMPFPAEGWSDAMTEYQKAELVNRRLVMAKEAHQAKRLNTELMKNLTGGDSLNARHPYGRPFSFRPVAKIFLAVNHKPIVRDDTHGFWRRVFCVPFTRTFAVDTTLEATLAAEAPGILAWAVRGCLLWQASGLQPPPSVRAATEEYRNQSDLLAQFFEARCLLDANARVRAGVLFEEYRKWCDLRHVPDGERLSQKDFGQRMKAKFRFQERSHVTTYLGIGLIEVRDLVPEF